MPPWRLLAEELQRSGRYMTELFLPDPLPPGFPVDLLARIKLWNDTFHLDFFTCRARLHDIAQETWRATRAPEILYTPDSKQLAHRVRELPETLVCFTDDDDWFAPTLATQLQALELPDICALRWCAPLFNGRWSFRFTPTFYPRAFVRTYRRIRGSPVLAATFRHAINWIAAPASVQPAGNIFFTNNYALGSRFLREYDTFAPAADHCDATDLFLRNRLPIKTYPSLTLSATNKHPCSAGVLGHAIRNIEAKSALRAYVSEYLDAAQQSQTPASLAWTQPYLARTIELFAEAPA
jgi:hypothetical protein